MVMGGKQDLGPVQGVAVKELGNSPGNADPVVGGCPPAYLVKQDQAAVRNIIKYAGRFIHLYHER